MSRVTRLAVLLMAFTCVGVTVGISTQNAQFGWIVIAAQFGGALLTKEFYVKNELDD